MDIRTVNKNDIKTCYNIEKACFEESEAASLDSIERRVDVYPAGFIVAEKDGNVVGMINSGSTDKEDITDEEFKKLIGHSENGINIVIFSVSVFPEYQGRGIAGALLNYFIKRSEQLKKKKILLLCKTELIGFYKKSGFSYNCKSNSTHGGFEWHEMAYLF